MAQHYAKIMGSGLYLPQKVVLNSDLEKLYLLEEGWIAKRTGIHERRRAEESLLEIYIRASLDALKNTNLSSIDTILVCRDVYSEDRAIHVAPRIQETLQKEGCAIKEVEYLDSFFHCGGFLHALDYARLRIQSEISRSSLIVAASRLSDFVHSKHPETGILWGDGAAAVVLGISAKPHFVSYYGISQPDKGHFRMSNEDGKPTILMDGRKVARFVLETVPRVVRFGLEKARLQLRDIQLFVFHQANARILESLQKSLHLPPEKLFVNLDCYGNTGIASLPIAYHNACEQGRLREGDYLLLCGFGAGLEANMTIYQV